MLWQHIYEYLHVSFQSDHEFSHTVLGSLYEGFMIAILWPIKINRYRQGKPHLKRTYKAMSLTLDSSVY